MAIQEMLLKQPDNYVTSDNLGLCDHLQIQISNEGNDIEWDRFLQETPGGHHVQSSLWAQLKATLGWRSIRLLITEEKQIVAGVQILTKSIPIMGKIGYIPRGPICRRYDNQLGQCMIDEINMIAKKQGIRYLLIQPPPDLPFFIDKLTEYDFEPTSICVTPTATVLIDLTINEDEILSQMRSQTRRNILRSHRSGLKIREGDQNDLPDFYHLLSATGKRCSFVHFQEDYFKEMYRLFHPHRGIKLIVAEYADEIVSMILLLSFNDTASCKFAAWSGRHGDCRPNEGIHWAGIRWAKSHGFHYYDFEGIDETVAKMLLDGQKIPEPMQSSTNRFKLGFKGKIQLSPRGYDHIYNPVLSYIYRLIYPIVKDSGFLQRLISVVRMSTKKLYRTQNPVFHP